MSQWSSRDVDDANAEALVKANPAKAVSACRRLADQGRPWAEFQYGSMYYFGLGLPKDLKEAMKWYRRSAQQGEPQAQYNLGLMYYNGTGIAQDYKQALAWYRRAAEQNQTNAQFNLGLMYYTGQGVPQDYKEAVKWYRRAADRICVGAVNLGVMYGAGWGVPQDYVLAHMWLNPQRRLPPGKDLDNAIKGRDHASSLMTPTQIEEAQWLAREWKPTTH
jgi:TPR repeat protein